jgi:hypothetical protein
MLQLVASITGKTLFKKMREVGLEIQNISSSPLA